MRIRKEFTTLAGPFLTVVLVGGGLVLAGCGSRAHRAAEAASRDVCTECHGPPDLTWIKIERSPGHRAHAEAGTECAECHRGDGHGETDLEWSCAGCHFEGDADHPSYLDTALADGHCTTCHAFKAERAPTKDMADRQCSLCHEEHDVEAATYPLDGPMKLPCYSCHEGHAEADKIGDCQRCHKDKHPGLEVTKAHTECQGCHEPHTWSFTEVKTCLKSDCHGSNDPAYDPTRSLDTLPLYGRGKRVRPYAHGIPRHNTCTACHRPHQWVVGPSQEPCRDCHTENKVNPHGPNWRKEHPRVARHQLERCTACHEDQTFCTSCHGLPLPHSQQFRRTREHGRLAIRNTALCAKCHSANRVCARCHTGSNRPSSHASGWRDRHPKAASANRALCYLCHGGNSCNRCHRTRMPHSAGWAAGGHKDTASFGPGSVCYRCHRRSWCGVCHG